MATVKEMKATARSRAGRGAARAERRAGRVPGVIYGDGKPPVTISLDHTDIRQKIYAGHFLTTIYDLDLDGVKHRVIPRDYQLDAVRGAPIHVDFMRLGEGATAFWTYAPAALAPPAWRPLAYVATTVFGITTSGLRMAFGGHFFTDVAIAGLVTFFVIWFAYALIYRWASSRLTDEQVDAALTRLAWPGYRLRRRLFSRKASPARSG